MRHGRPSLDHLLPLLFAIATLYPGFAAAQDAFDDFDADFGGDAGEESAPPPDSSPFAEFEEPAEGPPPPEESQEPPPSVEEPSEEPLEPTDEEAALDHRLFFQSNSYFGPAGGIHVVDAGGGAVGTFRVGLMLDFFVLNDFIIDGDRQKHVGGSLSLSYTPHPNIEVFGSVQSTANSNTTGDPELLQALGDLRLGLKAFHRLSPLLTLGGDVSLSLLNTVGDIGVVARSTSAGFRFNLSTDLRGRPDPVPFVFRFNLQYFFDNSSNLVDDVEDARFANLASPAPREDEPRHLITPVERFGLGINRVDFVNLGLGFEAPFEPQEDLLVSPLLEWTWNLPANRQGYDCLLVPTAPGTTDPGPGEDGCLDTEGVSAFPMTLSLGLKLAPKIKGLGLLLGVDVGLTGHRDPVRELALSFPYAVVLGASYGYDPRPPPEPEEEEEPPPPPPEPEPRIAGRVHGAVVSAPDEAGEGGGAPVGGATIAFVDRDLNSLIASEDGTFVTYLFEPGEEVVMEVSHPEYESARCSATIPLPPEPEPAPAPAVEAPGAEGSAKQGSAAAGAGAASEQAAPDAATTTALPTDEAGDLVVEVTCELPQLPRQANMNASLVDDEGGTVTGANVQITGPEGFATTAATDAEGRFTLEGLEPGTYTVRVDAEGYLLKLQQVEIEAREDANPTITVVRKPRRAMVRVRGRRIAIRRQINFATDSAEILPTSDSLLTEIADVLLRNEDIRLVEIQGHTDDRGGRAHNMRLSQERAEAVREWLITHGVDESRLEARGYGDTRPLVPNITAANRARNRRVQFLIKDRDR